jgi:hypothetical protein
VGAPVGATAAALELENRLNAADIKVDLPVAKIGLAFAKGGKALWDKGNKCVDDLQALSKEQLKKLGSCLADVTKGVVGAAVSESGKALLPVLISQLRKSTVAEETLGGLIEKVNALYEIVPKEAVLAAVSAKREALADLLEACGKKGAPSKEAAPGFLKCVGEATGLSVALPLLRDLVRSLKDENRTRAGSLWGSLKSVLKGLGQIASLKLKVGLEALSDVVQKQTQGFVDKATKIVAAKVATFAELARVLNELVVLAKAVGAPGSGK